MTFQPFTVRVHSLERLTPTFLRLVLSGDTLHDFTINGPILDQRIKFIIPTADGHLPTLPSDGSWFDYWRGLPEDERGHIRTYSVRELQDNLLTVDVVLHLKEGESGPAATWAANAEIGDELIVIGPGPESQYGGGIEFFPGRATEVRLIGDETAVPAVARILEDLPADASGEVLLEVPAAEDHLPLQAPPGIRVTWLDRNEEPFGAPLTRHLHIALDGDDTDEVTWETPTFSAAGEPVDVDKQPGEGIYYWIAGESGVVTALRRHLVKERGIPRHQVCFMGYWKVGVPMGT